ncbi:transposase domain-containing protein [Nocardia sp. NPDC052278]|uniref:transposase domain-containing protein n=1 Tax=unclassified Nocardia TaxID=2637762 RepID=UPI0036B276D9
MLRRPDPGMCATVSNSVGCQDVWWYQDSGTPGIDGFVLARQPVATVGVPLSAQSVIHRSVAVATGAFAPGHLGELNQIVPFEMVDDVLASTASTQHRVRDLPSRVVVYLLLAAGLFTEIGYGQGRARLTTGLDGLAVATGASSADPACGSRPACHLATGQ